MILPGILVEASWLAAHRGAVKVVDGRYYTAKYQRDGHAEFEAERIPGAVHIDLALEIADTSTGLRNSLAPAAMAAPILGAQKGLRREDAVVVYDAIGFSACRVAWVLEHYGQAEVAVLNGGLPAWKAADFPTESGPPTPPSPQEYAPQPRDARRLIDRDELRASLGHSGPAIADARSPARFEDEGRIPGARSLHYQQCFQEGSAMFRPAAELRKLFADAGLLQAPKLVASCGSGVTACIALWALRQLGRDDARLYDGSWNEWSGDPALPTEVGPRA